MVVGKQTPALSLRLIGYKESKKGKRYKPYVFPRWRSWLYGAGLAVAWAMAASYYTCLLYTSSKKENERGGTIMKKIMSMMLILTMSTVFMMGCSGGGNSQAPDTGQQERPVKVSLVTDVSGVNDQGFNQSSWEGMQRSAEDFNIEISYKESTQNADYIPNLNAMYDEKNDLILSLIHI